MGGQGARGTVDAGHGHRARSGCRADPGQHRRPVDVGEVVGAGGQRGRGDVAAGQQAVLAVIAARHGSTPREIGAKMLVRTDGSIVGSVGGGIMEYRTQQLARELLEPGAAPCRLAAFTTEGASDAAAIAACGGSMEVFLQRLEPEG